MTTVMTIGERTTGSKTDAHLCWFLSQNLLQVTHTDAYALCMLYMYIYKSRRPRHDVSSFNHWLAVRTFHKDFRGRLGALDAPFSAAQHEQGALQ